MLGCWLSENGTVEVLSARSDRCKTAVLVDCLKAGYEFNYKNLVMSLSVQEQSFSLLVYSIGSL